MRSRTKQEIKHKKADEIPIKKRKTNSTIDIVGDVDFGATQCDDAMLGRNGAGFDYDDGIRYRIRASGKAYRG